MKGFIGIYFSQNVEKADQVIFVDPAEVEKTKELIKKASEEFSNKAIFDDEPDTDDEYGTEAELEYIKEYLEKNEVAFLSIDKLVEEKICL
jgi:hypothetical protein